MNLQTKSGVGNWNVVNARPLIRAGLLDEANKESGEWVFVDPGFAMDGRCNCGLLEASAGREAVAVSFSKLKKRLEDIAIGGDQPLNLVIEAPLSVAFSALGNPAGRHFELRNGKSRYWYVGLGCSVRTSATYLLRAITDAKPTRKIRLFEGFVSFKAKGKSDHCKDVRDLKRVVWDEKKEFGQIEAANALISGHAMKSAFAVAGMDYQVPPVIIVQSSQP